MRLAVARNLTEASSVKEFLKRKQVIVGVALALVPLLLYTYEGLSVRLLADDFMFLGLPQRLGTWQAMLVWRDNWNGGYSSFLSYGLLAPLGAHAPPLFALAIIASALTGFAWLINVTLTYLRIGIIRVPITISLAALAVAGMINGLPAAQAFYWFTAAMVYTWPSLMFLLGIALVVEAARRPRGKRSQLLLALATTVYAFVNVGYGELSAVSQLVVITLILLFLLAFNSGPNRRSYRILAAAAILGTLAGFAMIMSAPGFANRSSATVNNEFLVQPVRELSMLISRTLESTLQYAGNEQSFAGFMLVVFAGMFATMSVKKRITDAENSRSKGASRAPLVFGLLVQLVFIPILWSHISDSRQLLDRFSFGFATVVGINLLLIALMLAQIWRRRLDQLLQRQHGLMALCILALMLICVFFTMSQLRSIHYKAASYLFYTSVSLLLMIESLLTYAIADPRLNRLFQGTAFVTATAMILLAALLGVKMFAVGYIVERTLTSTTTILIIAGLMNGITVGALIRASFRIANAHPFWIRLTRLICILGAITIAVGITAGQLQRIPYTRNYVEVWDAAHEEITRLRDAGDPAVYAALLPQLHSSIFTTVPSHYRSAPLDWPHIVFFGLDPTKYADRCYDPLAQAKMHPDDNAICALIENDGQSAPATSLVESS